MVTQLSPGVAIQEFSIDGVVPAVATSDGAIAGMFLWGPINFIFHVENEGQLNTFFGPPNGTNANDWFSAANFLAYSNSLWVVRVGVETNANTSLNVSNACAANSHGMLVRNLDEYNNLYSNGQLKSTYHTGDWIARYAGALGNSLKVSVCPSANAYSQAITGTVSITANSTAVTGVSTLFTTQVVPGDFLLINTEIHEVATIADSTHLTLSDKHSLGATSTSATRYWQFYQSVSGAPGTSNYAKSYGGTNDEMHVVVQDFVGTITGTPLEVLEVFQYVSKGSDALQSDGQTSNYYVNVVNSRSNWILWAGHDSSITDAGDSVKSHDFVSPSLPYTFALEGGRDGAALTSTEKMRGYGYFQSSEDVDISLVIGSDANQTVANYIINDIVEARQDCVAFFSPLSSNVVNNAGYEGTSIVTFRNQLPSTSYAALDSNWKYQYDKYNDVYRWLPLNGDCAGLWAQTDKTRDPWWAAAGFNRGLIKNAIKLAWNPKQADRDLLYNNGINPCLVFPGNGAMVYGQKTLLTRPGEFDRINVRRLFIVLEKAIGLSAKYFLFEFNDEITRANFVNIVDPYLRNIQSRRGIYAYKIICDTTVNTPEVIAAHQFIGDIFVQPEETAEFIQLNFVAVGATVDITTLTGASI